MRSKVAQRILAETPEETKVFARMYADIVVRIHELLKENHLNQKELADKLEKRPSEINKWLTGEHNFTLRSLAKLQVELGEPIINVPHRKSITAADGTAGYVTVYKNTAAITNDAEFKTVWKKSKPNTKTPLANVS
ncbi:helix-turn-helix domain-containing protein [Flavobacterium sp. Sd200]|uniref:helix-turn-helix transcriptional regulator n=1 Tax=Flavobacterium sp. Sd200 TaxID=2692211 RepID=UPI00136C7815|nr:helix-turn-helix transcriptional regulator [Flavobacterium sp. Sd200]MXN91281.1 helix-turn-helix domain-containing protein [Flavobacterium sp. Sd200]